MAHNPVRTLRFFTFGTEPAFGHKAGVAWCRSVGCFFAVGGSLGLLLYLVLLPIDFWRSHLGLSLSNPPAGQHTENDFMGRRSA